MSKASLQTTSMAGLYLAVAVAHAVALELGDWWFRESWFRDSPVGGTPPWYFIGRDLSVGPFVGLASIILALIIVVFRRMAGPFSWAVLASVPVTFGGSCALAVNVLLHCSNLSDPAVAWSSWSTFEEYMASQATASAAGLASGFILALLCLVGYARASRAANLEAA